LEQQKEVDRTRLGATGCSYGGSLMWNLATDRRVKAVVAYFGIGYNTCYRDHHVWIAQMPVLNVNDYYHTELEITASDQWQEMQVPAARLKNRFNQQPLRDWSAVGRLHFQPKPGADLTKVLFADLKWQQPKR
jgi:dienelactone hydrolase